MSLDNHHGNRETRLSPVRQSEPLTQDILRLSGLGTLTQRLSIFTGRPYRYAPTAALSSDSDTAVSAAAAAPASAAPVSAARLRARWAATWERVAQRSEQNRRQQLDEVSR